VLGVSPGAYIRLLGSVFKQLFLAIVTVTSVLGFAFLMNYSGMAATLGLAFASTGGVFPFFSALLGWLGVFMTGSDVSSNALFANLQVITANQLGFDPALLASANSAGGVMGKMISLQSIAVAGAATLMSSAEQVKLFRFTLKHSIFLASVLGMVTMFYAYTF
jgi:lactate permease